MSYENHKNFTVTVGLRNHMAAGLTSLRIKNLREKIESGEFESKSLKNPSNLNLMADALEIAEDIMRQVAEQNKANKKSDQAVDKVIEGVSASNPLGMRTDYRKAKK